MEEIENRWQCELDQRWNAKPDPFSDPPEVTRYYQAWKKANRNKNGSRADHYTAVAYELWARAVSDSEQAACILGEVHDQVEDFDNLPKPGGSRVRETKREIAAVVLANYKANPDNYESEY